MDLKKLIYIKKQQFSRFLALGLARNRAFTALQLIIKTLAANRQLPEKIIALEVFGFIGTSTSLDYAHLTEYLELWEFDPYYAQHAQKINAKAKVMCGDSIDALAKGKVLRKDYNFVVIDPNISSRLNDGTYESFGVFANSLNYTAEKAVIIVTIYNDLKNLAALYKTSVEEFGSGWIKARKEFYSIDNVIDAPALDYLPAFENIIRQKGYKVQHSQFLSRNEAVGFGVFVIER